MPADEELQPGLLRGFDHFKLELAAVIRSLRQIAGKQKDAQKSDECRKLLARLAEDRFNLVVAGQFSRGKTSLMNAILGVDRLPTGILPLTSVITAVSYGDRERVLVHWDRWSYTSEISLRELPEYVTQEGNPGNRKRVRSVEVQLPLELLRLGFYFVDTPGIGSAIAANTATTTSFLPEADAVIFVTSFESPLTEAELNFFEQVRAYVRKIFVVINKRDLAPTESQDSVLKFVERQLKEICGDPCPRIYSVSARDGLRAKQNSDTDALQHSGIPQLETDLIQFLDTDKMHDFLERISGRASAILSRLIEEYELSQSVSADAEKRRSLEEALSQRVNQIRGGWERSKVSLRGKLAGALVARFEPALERPLAEIRATAEQNIIQYVDGQASFTDSFNAGLAAAVDSSAQRILTDWLSETQRELRQVVDAVAHEELRDVLQGLLEIDQSQSTEGRISEILRDLSLSFRRTSPDLWNFNLPWWMEPLLSIRVIRGRIRRWCLKRLDKLVPKFYCEVLRLWNVAAEDWTEQLDHALSEVITSTAESQLHTLTRTVDREERDTLTQIRCRLNRVNSSLSHIDFPHGPPASGGIVETDHVPRSDVTARCLICVQVEAGLFEFMRHRQYELSTSAPDQAAHAEQSGFCGLHTWQYEAIASPQGVCTAYPAVLSTMQRRLRSLARRASSTVGLAEAVAETLPRAIKCRACQLIAGIERTAAHEIVSRLASSGESADLPPLCMRHLHSVLLAKPNLETARLLVEEQSRVLERVSEHMQRYAIKHEAVRRELATELEHRAYEIGLSRLAGLRSTVAPWKTDPD